MEEGTSSGESDAMQCEELIKAKFSRTRRVNIFVVENERRGFGSLDCQYQSLLYSLYPWAVNNIIILLYLLVHFLIQFTCFYKW